MRNMTELEANTEVDGDRAFETSFSPQQIHEVMLEFHPKKWGPPIVTLTGHNGGSREIHPAPQRGRPGHFLQRIEGDETWSGVRVTIGRGKKGKLVKVKLVGKGAGVA